jgi:sugar phosphate isomerase/epimerase
MNGAIQPIIAAQMYTLRDFTQSAEDLAVSLKKVRRMGYSSVQISAIGAIPDQEVKAILDAVGLSVCITHPRLAWPWQDLDGLIAQHKLWNCPNVAVGSMPEAYRTSEEGFRQFARDADRVGQTLAEAGLTFSYHNHSFEFVRFGSRSGLELLYAETDPRYVMAELDTYWVQHGGGDPAWWVRRLAGRMPVIHLKDMAVIDGQPTMTEVGEGNLNWTAILEACKESGVEWCAVEQDVCRRDPFESLKISYENLKKMGLK